LRKQLKQALIDEQGGLCAYTGIRIDADRSHIEHLIPQAHCEQGVGDVAYLNMVACYPSPDEGHVPFGAVFKKNWPAPAEQHLFVSPRTLNCEARFTFSLGGVISASATDPAASKTIAKLGLDNKKLTGMRKAAIDATLGIDRRNSLRLDVANARRRLRSLEEADSGDGPLEPFCFVLKQALAKHLRRLENIRNSRHR